MAGQFEPVQWMHSKHQFKIYLYGLAAIMNGVVILNWMLALLGSNLADHLLPYELNWFTVFPYLLMIFLLIPARLGFLRYGIALINGYFLVMYVYTAIKLLITGHADTSSPLWVLLVFGIGATLLNIGVGIASHLNFARPAEAVAH